MKAVKQFKTAEESNRNGGSLTALSERRPSQDDRLYALLRRLSQRLSIVESKLSACQRDVYRIEKKHQRSGDAILPPSQTEQSDPMLENLFGGN